MKKRNGVKSTAPELKQTKEPIEFFLVDLKDTVYYETIVLSLRSDLKIKEIAEDLDITDHTAESRIYYGALKIGIKRGRDGLKAAYIEFLEDWITQRGMK